MYLSKKTLVLAAVVAATILVIAYAMKPVSETASAVLALGAVVGFFLLLAYSVHSEYPTREEIARAIRIVRHPWTSAKKLTRRLR